MVPLRGQQTPSLRLCRRYLTETGAVQPTYLDLLLGTGPLVFASNLPPQLSAANPYTQE